MSVIADTDIIKLRRAVISGINSEGHPALIADSQCVRLINADLSQPGRLKKREGYVKRGNETGVDSFKTLCRFNPVSAIETLLSYDGKSIRALTDKNGSWSQPIVSNLSASDNARFIVGNDKVLFINGKDNAHLIDADLNVTALGDDNTAPPKGDVGCFFKDRYFVARESYLYFSNVAGSDFDRNTNFFRVSPGDNDVITNLIPFRNNELIIFKEHSIWMLKIFGTDISGWYLEPVNVKTDDRSTSSGCIAKDAAVRVGDDIYFFSSDGIRSLRRNEQDKIYGLEMPESDLIASDWIDLINWQYKDKIRSVSYKNRIIFAVCSEFATEPDMWFVLHLQRDSALSGWSVFKDIPTSCFVKAYDKGKEKLYFAGLSQGQLYEMFNGTSDDGSGIEFELISRLEDLGTLNFQANSKRAASFYIRGTAKHSSTLTVMIRFDENISWETLGTIDLSKNIPALPLTLPLNLNGKNVVEERFNNLSDYGVWTNFQVRLYQAADPESSCEILEYMLYIQDVNDYSFV
nr:hypothetical protein 26 [bacterium]